MTLIEAAKRVQAAWQDPLGMAELCKAMDALDQAIAQPEQEPVRVPVTDNTYNYAKSLAEAIFKQHFASDEHYASGQIVWGVNDTVIGILTQIDNMVADMVRRPVQQQKEGFASPGGGYVPAIPRPIPLDWKLVPKKATPEMLRAMDECAQEGYDERLYEGMASSVYMAAWDASPVLGTLPEQPAQQQEPVAYVAGYFSGRVVVEPVNRALVMNTGTALYTTPPQRTWQGLTDDEIYPLYSEPSSDAEMVEFARAIEARLKEKNT